MRKVAVFYPRPSSAYDTAISKILGVFAEKGINAEFTVYNFRTDDAEGEKALKVGQEERRGADLRHGFGIDRLALLAFPRRSDPRHFGVLEGSGAAGPDQGL